MVELKLLGEEIPMIVIKGDKGKEEIIILNCKKC